MTALILAALACKDNTTLDTGIAPEQVVVTWDDTWLGADGSVLVVPRDPFATELRGVELWGADGAVQSATALDGGAVTFSGSAQGATYVERTQPPTALIGLFEGGVSLIPTGGDDRIQRGLAWSGRPDVEVATGRVGLTLELSGLSPFQQVGVDGETGAEQPLQDRLVLHAYGAGALADLTPHPDDAAFTGAPAHGDSAATLGLDWAAFAGSYAVTGAPLVDATRGDTLEIVQVVAAPYPQADDAWAAFPVVTAARGWTGSVSLIDGGDTAVQAALAPLETVTGLELRTADLGALLEADGPDSLRFAYTSATVFMEPGSPEPVIGVTVPLLEAYAYSAQVPANPECYPEEGGCDEAACPDGCDETLVWEHPGDLSPGLSFGLSAGPGTPLVQLYGYWQTRVGNPIDGQTERLSGSLATAVPLDAALAGPVEPLLGLPTGLAVNGEALPVEVVLEGVGITPTISFIAPTLGSPSQYLVHITDLSDLTAEDGTVLSSSRLVAQVVTTGTELVVPEGVLVEGRAYTFTVSAQLGVRQPDLGWASTQAYATQGAGVFVP